MQQLCSSVCSKSKMMFIKASAPSVNRLLLLRVPSCTARLPRERQYSSETSKNIAGQKRAHKAFKLFHISSMVSGIAIFLVARYYFKDSQRKKLEQRQQGAAGFEEDETFTWEHCDKSSKSFIKLENTWFPTSLISSRARLEKIKNFELRPGDIVVSSYPKSGTTWMQEIVYFIKSNLDVDKAKKSKIEERFPYLEFLYPGLKELEKLPSPRLLKTHLPFHLLPKGVQDGQNKVICIVRNPKDVLVSYFHFVRMLGNVSYKGSLEELAEYFIQGKVGYGPWWDHVLGFWKHRGDDNVLFVKYEDLHQDPEKVIGEVASFLGHPLSDLQIKYIAKYTSFEKMKESPTSNYSWWTDTGMWNKEGTNFMRKGVVGDWQGTLSSDVSKKIDGLCEELTKNGLTFTYTKP